MRTALLALQSELAAALADTIARRGLVSRREVRADGSVADVVSTHSQRVAKAERDLADVTALLAAVAS